MAGLGRSRDRFGSTTRVGRRLERTLTFADGEAIVREGDRGREMFFVQRGAVRIVRRRPDGDVELDRIERGGFFGEMSLLESLPRDADAVAVGPTEVLAIGSGGLLVRLRNDPSLALEMLHQLSGRVRSLNARIDDR